jgi:hypothetical protein
LTCFSASTLASIAVRFLQKFSVEVDLQASPGRDHTHPVLLHLVDHEAARRIQIPARQLRLRLLNLPGDTIESIHRPFAIDSLMRSIHIVAVNERSDLRLCILKARELHLRQQLFPDDANVYGAAWFREYSVTPAALIY